MRNRTSRAQCIPQDKVRSLIRAHMKSRGLSLLWLSGNLGYKNKQTVHNYMSSINFTPGTLKRWSEILGYPYELLIEGKPYDGIEKKTISDRLIDIEVRLQNIEKQIRRIDSRK